MQQRGKMYSFGGMPFKENFRKGDENGRVVISDNDGHSDYIVHNNSIDNNNKNTDAYNHIRRYTQPNNGQTIVTVKAMLSEKLRRHSQKVG